MRSAHAALLVACAMLGPILGCEAGSRYSVELKFKSGVDPEYVRFIDLVVLPQCPTATRVLAGLEADPPVVAELSLFQAESPLPALGSLPPGTYGLYARGFGADCTTVVAGCSTVRLTDHGSDVLSVMLEPTAELSKCPADGLCLDGACVVDSNDACVSDPCPSDSYCTDLPAPAPVDPSGRICIPNTHCGPGEYQVTAPTPREDRRCASCSTCAPTEIELVACADGDVPQDRVCGLGDQVCTLVAALDGEANSSILYSASGTGKTMRITYDGVTPFYGFVQFFVAGATCQEGGSIPAGSVVQSASLELTRQGGCYICGRGHALRRVTESWDESSVVVGLGPRAASAESATFDAPDSGNPVLVAVPALTADVQEMLDSPGLDHGWRIEQVELPGNGLSPYSWSTRESDSSNARPRLIITYQVP